MAVLQQSGAQALQTDRTAVDAALLVARIVVGSIFIAHGAQKLFGAWGGPGLAGVVQMMGPIGYAVAIGEFFGGLGLLVGFLSRFSAASLIVIMLGAIGMVHGKNGFFLGEKPGFEYALALIGLLAPVLIAVRPIDPGVRIGHVHLKVADLERAVDFYCGVLGFNVMQRWGEEAAFISAGGYHHHIGLNTWESRGGSPPPPGATGLYHVALLYPTRAALADALRRLIAAGVPLDGASDHGVSEALYLRDPDNNGVELYWDRPLEEWPRSPSGGVAMYSRALDLNGLLGETSL